MTGNKKLRFHFVDISGLITIHIHFITVILSKQAFLQTFHCGTLGDSTDKLNPHSKAIALAKFDFAVWIKLFTSLSE